ncbi:DUF4331 family protein [Sphingomonas sanxanigenens]|nr:DUF4331 family protein [Sphingomonas sanxanigenens]
MSRLMRTLAIAGACALAAPALFFSAQYFSPAADHLDPPGRTDKAFDTTPDRAADIADVYTWHTDTALVIAMTFAGPAGTNRPGTYDRDVLYGINVSTDGVRETTELPIRVRFGSGGGGYGVQFSGLPGVATPFAGPVETDLTTPNGIKVRAGLFDDPFFFDLQGFRETRSTGMLRFDRTRDFFAGQNDTAIVIEIPRAALPEGTGSVDIWGSTARFAAGES